MQNTIDKSVLMIPEDKFNRALTANVHPDDWVNPEPSGKYNLVVIGAGTAGLVSAAGAAGLGAKVALVERFLMGGDCLNFGCVPSKGVIASSRVMDLVKQAGLYGVKSPQSSEVDFAAVMERMRRLRARISQNDSVKRFKELGVDVYLGDARFSGPASVEVDGKTLRFSRAVIATGARPSEPGIPGLKESGYLTNETVFSLTERPARLAVLGGGPIGCEMAQALARLGCQVFLFHRNAHILDREDQDAADIIQNKFIKEGIQLFLTSQIKQVELQDREKLIHYEAGGKSYSVTVDQILVGVGRTPNVENLNLEGAGVQYDRTGVLVDDRLRTGNPRIFAAGDVCTKYKFTHIADATARIVIQNALFHGSQKLSSLIVPWCTYTDPEIAHVGMYEQDAARHGIEVDTYVRTLNHIDRAILEGQDEGFVKIHTKKGTDRIIGATIVAAHAGEMISEITTALASGIGLKNISTVIPPYPTQAEAIKQVGDAYNRTRLTSLLKKIFSYWFAWNR
jgi:pyruvate/2-oxoglutarate dehydrogenase complex dihydrolipoamide dehydrogenase (E3) component